MLVRHLRNFQQSQLILVLNQSTTFNVGPCFVGYLHDEFVLMNFAAQQIVEDIQVNGRAKVIDVGQEAVLTALVDEFLEESRVLERLVEISVTGWVPAAKKSMTIYYSKLQMKKKSLVHVSITTYCRKSYK